MSGGFSKSKSIVTFRLHPNCFVKLFYRIWSSHSRKSRNSISRALAIRVLLCCSVLFMRRLQHSLHINYIIIWWWFLGTWSPISWYLSGYLRPLHMLAWAYRLLFFYWHWSFIARMRFHEANTNTLNHKNTEPNCCGVNESSTVEGKKKICDVLLPKITIKSKKRKSEGKTSIQTEKVKRNAVSKKISA